MKAFPTAKLNSRPTSDVTSGIRSMKKPHLKITQNDKSGLVSFFMNRFRKLGFVDYEGAGLQVHSSLLNIVLHD
jgi:hypothetical protein